MAAASAGGGATDWRLRNLIPFHSMGLCDAVITTPASALRCRTIIATPGVVTISRSITSTPLAVRAAAAALTASGVAVIDLDIVTTPGVAMMVRHLNADAGVVITASHNPIEWNGIKFLNRQSVAPPPADAAAIKQFYNDQRTAFVPVEELVAPKKNTETHALHVKRV